MHAYFSLYVNRRKLIDIQQPPVKLLIIIKFALKRVVTVRTPALQKHNAIVSSRVVVTTKRPNATPLDGTKLHGIHDS